MFAGRLLAALILTAFTLCTQQQGSADASVATIATTAPGARFENARARSASIKRKRLDITPAGLTGVASLEHMLSRAFLRVLDDEAGAAEDVSSAARFDPYRTQVVDRGAYAESERTVPPANRAIEARDVPPWRQPTDSGRSSCWWLWLYCS
jgi:hypothetical protein